MGVWMVEATRYPLYRRLGGPQGRPGRLRKFAPPVGFDPRTVQPVASSCRPTRKSYSSKNSFSYESNITGLSILRLILFEPLRLSWRRLGLPSRTPLWTASAVKDICMFQLGLHGFTSLTHSQWYRMTWKPTRKSQAKRKQALFIPYPV